MMRAADAAPCACAPSIGRNVDNTRRGGGRPENGNAPVDVPTGRSSTPMACVKRCWMCGDQSTAACQSCLASRATSEAHCASQVRLHSKLSQSSIQSDTIALSAGQSLLRARAEGACCVTYALSAAEPLQSHFGHKRCNVVACKDSQRIQSKPSPKHAPSLLNSVNALDDTSHRHQQLQPMQQLNAPAPLMLPP
eukprot:365535-Chlamydomonas_euryale.AAC.73